MYLCCRVQWRGLRKNQTYTVTIASLNNNYNKSGAPIIFQMSWKDFRKCKLMTFWFIKQTFAAHFCLWWDGESIAPLVFHIQLHFRSFTASFLTLKTLLYNSFSSTATIHIFRTAICYALKSCTLCVFFSLTFCPWKLRSGHSFVTWALDRKYFVQFKFEPKFQQRIVLIAQGFNCNWASNFASYTNQLVGL